MSRSERRTITLPSDQAGDIAGLVKSGSYASVSEVVRAGIQVLQDQDTAVDRWLRDDVVPVFDAMQADLARGVPVDSVRARLQARHTDRIVKSRNRER
jgi:antitoxin ParD1/3/4